MGVEGGSAFCNEIVKRIIWHNQRKEDLARARCSAYVHSTANLDLWHATKKLWLAILSLLYAIIAMFLNISALMQNILGMFLSFTMSAAMFLGFCAAYVSFILLVPPVICSYVTTVGDPRFNDTCSATGVQISVFNTTIRFDAFEVHLFHAYMYTVVDVMDTVVEDLGWVIRRNCERQFGKLGVTIEDMGRFVPIKRV